MQGVDEDLIDTQSIDAEIDKAIVDAYTGVVHDMKQDGKLVRHQRDIGKAGTRHVLKKISTEMPEEEPDVADSQSLTARAQPSRENRLLQRRSSIINYKPSDSNLTPFLRKKRKLTGMVKHASTVELIHNTERERKENEFRHALADQIMKVADELKIDINMQQIYNCQGIIEAMRRNKGIVISGPRCSGKTQLVKIATIALKRAFNVTLRSSFITPETFSEDELFGPTQAF